ncbi:hypothetical protein AM500_05135 [Bacillus sp. FJAT-18017]|uniref:nucleotide exchange factor GrpE n=1 Tax=Bacillus sp. FJAT-18017 TaxID=1705566 RepID=UPI0006ADB3F7|nr:nucleotide exchange factor GrpE [Bacillus sp. FJAT-18017]ALC89234.1 hypothetical protein AM500_05135 [Bacillus sp. FJAT-18017]
MISDELVTHDDPNDESGERGGCGNRAAPLSIFIGHVGFYTSKLYHLVLVETYLSFNEQINLIRANFPGEPAWLGEIEKMRSPIFTRVADLLGGENKLDQSLRQELMNDLLKLPKLQETYTVNEVPVEADQSIQSIIDAVLNEVKKGNRANFRVLQDLQAKMEQLAVDAQEEEKGAIAETLDERAGRIEDLKKLAIEMFDQLDIIYSAVQRLGNEAVTSEVKKVIDKAIKILETNGIEELQVQNKFIDGKIMISLGNVPRNEYAPQLEQYQVYQVHQRGFRDKETNQLLRKATVITVD